MERKGPKMVIPVRRFVLMGSSLVAILSVVLLNRSASGELELSILKGVPIHEYRPYDGNRFSQTIYYVEMDYDDALLAIDRELPGWMGPYGEAMKTKGWMEKPGPFQFHGRQVSIGQTNVTRGRSSLRFGGGF